MSNAWDDMKKAKEDQYFMQKDKKILDKKHEDLEKEEFEAHFKNRCPKCGDNLKEENFHGVNIDRCTSCNGIWLDDGELEQLQDSEKAISWFDKLWSNR
jgi:phage FluMu protein Com